MNKKVKSTKFKPLRASYSNIYRTVKNKVKPGKPNTKTTFYVSTSVNKIIKTLEKKGGDPTKIYPNKESLNKRIRKRKGYYGYLTTRYRPRVSASYPKETRAQRIKRIKKISGNAWNKSRKDYKRV